MKVTTNPRSDPASSSSGHGHFTNGNPEAGFAKLLLDNTVWHAGGGSLDTVPLPFFLCLLFLLQESLGLSSSSQVSEY